MDAYVAKPLRGKDVFAAIESVLDPEHTRLASGQRSGTDVVDETRLLSRVGGDRKSLNELVALFLDDAPKLLGRINRAIDEKDAGALQAAAHTLKGAVSNFAAPAATEAAARLQRTGESGELDGARDACEVLEEELEQLKLTLSALVGKSPS
jgi:HPt (histidine-containing phosphotransfer) domain-containing protein